MTCRWRILQVTRLSLSDRGGDSAAASGMKQRLMASVLHRALVADLPSPSAHGVYRNSAGTLAVSPPDRLPSRIVFGPSILGGLFRSVSLRTDVTVESK